MSVLYWFVYSFLIAVRVFMIALVKLWEYAMVFSFWSPICTASHLLRSTKITNTRYESGLDYIWICCFCCYCQFVLVLQICELSKLAVLCFSWEWWNLFGCVSWCGLYAFLFSFVWRTVHLFLDGFVFVFSERRWQSTFARLEDFLHVRECENAHHSRTWPSLI